TAEIISSSNGSITFSQLSSIPSNGASIAVKVRATVNNIVGSWGNSCTISTQTQQVSRNIIQLNTEEIKAYPNPFSNEFTLKLSDESEANIQVFDINGKLVHNQLINNTSEVVLGEDFSLGIYLVNVSQNKETRTFKIIKK
ncbi:MAG: T9SS type A sorting domain-containing protein, partial [Flavobacterium sp.]